MHEKWRARISHLAGIVSYGGPVLLTGFPLVIWAIQAAKDLTFPVSRFWL